MAAGPWVLEEYQAGPRRPVREFIDGLSKGAQAKVLASLQMLREHGHRLRMPLSRAMGEGLYELRIPHPEGPFRVLYVYAAGRRIILLHAFVKRTQQTPPQELARARRRMRELNE
jgi:phage-related protein